MKACIIQPPYSYDFEKADECFAYKMNLLQACDETVDIIVLPEYSDVPCVTSNWEETLAFHEQYIDVLLQTCRETALRCHALVFVNALSKEDTGYRNTTYVFDREGKLCGKYFKKHLPPVEMEVLKLDSDYTMEYSEPYILELEGIRFGFMTCYDFYFYEAFANIARNHVDVIIGCSLQRSDSHHAIETMCRFLAYNTNSYVIRSSVSFSEESEICGASMIVSPEGKVLANMKGRFGLESIEFDPKQKYYKAAGFGNPPASHYEYIEYGRKPWQYRPAGSAIVKSDKQAPYPRVCAHRGFPAIAPENSMPAYGAAVALGVDEIEFDLWPTKDGEIVSIHDDTLDRVSNGTGKVYEYTYDELKAFDFGIKRSDSLKGLRILRFEEILQKLGCHVIMNIHIKTFLGKPYDEEILKKIVSLIYKYDCQDHVYFLVEQDMDVALFRKCAPDISLCMGHDFGRNWDIVDRAIALGLEKLQFFSPYYNQEMVDKARAHGIICNFCGTNDPEEAKKLVKMGMDTILTDECQLILDADIKNTVLKVLR